MKNIIEIMEKSLFNICQEIDVSVRTANLMRRNNVNSILDILKRKVMNKPYKPAMIKKVESEICLILNYYGIDYNNIEQCKELIQQYNLAKNNDNTTEKQIENNEPVIEENKTVIDTEQTTTNSLQLLKIMETPIESLGLNGRVLNPLKKYINYEVQCRVIDVLKFIAECYDEDYYTESPLLKLPNFGYTSNNSLKKILLPFGINIDNVKNCKEMIEQYEQIKNLKKENSAIENQTEIVKSMNDELKEEIKRELERNQLLKAKLAQQEQEFYALINIRNSIKEITNGNLESSNNHGTK